MSLVSSQVSVGGAPGLHGEIELDELVIQQIWHEQLIDDTGLQTQCGKSIKVKDVGFWNREDGGPKFRNAEIQIGDQSIHGDVEIYFRPSDWMRHRYHQDQNFKGVVLRVCLYLEKGIAVNGPSNNPSDVPILHLLPYLTQGLEEYVEEFALRKLAGLSSLHSVKKLASLKPDKECLQLAKRRWKQKCKFAKARLQKFDWQCACHQWFLEVLGYSKNRVPMTRVALEYPVDCWSDFRLNVEDLFSRQKGWRLNGCRPANHPLTRLIQYQKLCNDNPSWTEQLLSFDILEEGDACTHNRKNLRIAQCNKIWREEILKSIFGETRANTLLVDTILPLLSVYQGKDYFATWCHWFAGDCPTLFRESALRLGWIDGTLSSPFSNGIVQAIIGYLIEEDQ